MNPLANLAALLGIKPRHPKHRRYARWWKGVLEAKRKARRDRRDNWTRALLAGQARSRIERYALGFVKRDRNGEWTEVLTGPMPADDRRRMRNARKQERNAR